MSSGNVTSVLLSPQENQRVFSMLGPRRKERSRTIKKGLPGRSFSQTLSLDYMRVDTGPGTVSHRGFNFEEARKQPRTWFYTPSLATSVVELYTAGGRYNARSTACWTYCTMGVLCLVKDAQQRSYFFRVYCPVKGILVWEQEFYSGMVYLQPKPYLHTFEAEDCIAGFNFADESEAAAHRRVVLEKLELKNRQLERRLTRRRKNSSFEMVEKPDFLSGVVQPNVEEPKPSKKSSKKKDSAKKKPKLAKVDISTPFDFKHICHVGWNKDRGFDFLNADPQLKAFFQQAGISETHLRHKGTRDFIYKFIEDNGGMDALAVEMDPAGRRPQQPTSNSHQQQRSSNNNGPQQVNIYEELKSFPNDAGRNSNKKQQLQKRQLPPPPPLLTVTGADGKKTGLVPPPPALPPSRQQVAPPPPPPPPISPPIPPPIVVDRDPQPSSVEDPRSNLLQEIRSGKALKHIGDNDKKEPTTLGSRNQLLDQIKSGVHLRSTPTSPSSSPRQSKAIEQSGGLAGALAKALQERTKAMHSDSSGGSSEDEEDEEEWND